MMRYYLLMERILQLEWFINKIQFRASELIHLENAIESGGPFWQEDEFDARVAVEHAKDRESLHKGLSAPNRTQRVQEFLSKEIVGLRSKRNMAEEIASLGATVKSLINEYTSTKGEQRNDYLQSYCEFRYL